MIEHAVVELREEVGRWPSGTKGTVISELPGGVLIEISDDEGRTLDLVEVPEAGFKVIQEAKGHGTQEFATQ